MDSVVVLTRFEVARLVGLRSLRLSEGAPPLLFVNDPILKEDTMYVAALELKARVLDAKLNRNGTLVDTREAQMPACLDILLDTRDGGTRSYRRVTE